ncbi:MAG: OmpA family protein [Deltaproteobacteria bacterium]
MPHDQRRFAYLMLAVAVSIAPVGALAAEQEPGPPPAAPEAPAKPDPTAEEAKPARQDAPEEGRQQRFDARQKQKQQFREDRRERQQESVDQRRERNQERTIETQQNIGEQQRRREDTERASRERDERKARRQEELLKQREAEQQQRQDDAERVKREQNEQKTRQLEEQQRQQREADEQRRREDIERTAREQDEQKVRQLEEQQRQQREAEQQRRQEEAERVKGEQNEQKTRQLEEQQRQKREAERVPANPESPEKTVPAPDQVETPIENSKPGPPQEAIRKIERPEGGGTIPAIAEPPAASSPQSPPATRRIQREDIRRSYRLDPRQQRSFEELKQKRRERTVADGKVRLIEEPDRRVIVKQNDRVFIRHDESERFRRIAPDARTIRRADGTQTTFMTRRGGVRIYDVTDRHGRLLYRYRRYPDGREVVLIDNRRYYRSDDKRTRDVLIGAGIGLLLGSAIALAAPDVRIPRDEYIVDYGRASEDDLYEALIAPPVERLDRGYSLEEIRYSRNLRDRMRRIDLDTVTFDFGSWDVGPDQARALDRLANGILRMLERNPDEIVMIEGHTDAVGSEEDNLTLSDRRAQSVAEILTIDYGVPPENLVTQGYGEEQLKIPTDGPERANRRIAVRRIGPLLSGRFDDDRYGGPPPRGGWDDGRGGYDGR